MKLWQDFGVSALIATLIVIGGFSYLIIGLVLRLIDVHYATVIVSN